MMMLSTMQKVLRTIDREWRSPIAEQILTRWGYDKGSVYYFRSSANFIFVFKRSGKRYFLRFNDSSERELNVIESEINILKHLHSSSINVAQPVKSLNNNLIEVVNTEIGTFYSVVFEALEGKQFELEELEKEDYFVWGSTLGKLHNAFKSLPKQLTNHRPSWKNHFAFIDEQIQENEAAAIRVLKQIKSWTNDLHTSNENYGLIHFDFELDNQRWGNNNEISVLDFDDSSIYWYVADIAFALRDLFEQEVDLNHPLFLEFMRGYSNETSYDESNLQDLHMFLKLHNLVLFAKLLRSIDIEESTDLLEEIDLLKTKLVNKINSIRASFEDWIEVYNEHEKRRN